MFILLLSIIGGFYNQNQFRFTKNNFHHFNCIIVFKLKLYRRSYIRNYNGNIIQLEIISHLIKTENIFFFQHIKSIRSHQF